LHLHLHLRLALAHSFACALRSGSHDKPTRSVIQIVASRLCLRHRTAPIPIHARNLRDLRPSIHPSGHPTVRPSDRLSLRLAYLPSNIFLMAAVEYYRGISTGLNVPSWRHATLLAQLTDFGLSRGICTWTSVSRFPMTGHMMACDSRREHGPR
jgi:hypothetical protein